MCRCSRQRTRLRRALLLPCHHRHHVAASDAARALHGRRGLAWALHGWRGQVAAVAPVVHLVPVAVVAEAEGAEEEQPFTAGGGTAGVKTCVRPFGGGGGAGLTRIRGTPGGPLFREGDSEWENENCIG